MSKTMVGVRVYRAAKGECVSGTGHMYRFDGRPTAVRGLHSTAPATMVGNALGLTREIIGLIEDDGERDGVHQLRDGSYVHLQPVYSD